MRCPDCDKAANAKHHGGYRLQCLHCCARLVASARPSRLHQEAMLAAIARFAGAPGRDEVLACVRQTEPDEKPLSTAEAAFGIDEKPLSTAEAAVGIERGPI